MVAGTASSLFAQDGANYTPLTAVRPGATAYARQETLARQEAAREALSRGAAEEAARAMAGATAARARTFSFSLGKLGLTYEEAPDVTAPEQLEELARQRFDRARASAYASEMEVAGLGEELGQAQAREMAARAKASFPAPASFVPPRRAAAAYASMGRAEAGTSQLSAYIGSV